MARRAANACKMLKIHFARYLELLSKSKENVTLLELEAIFGN